jgi:SAM-dependent methyltransferase
MDVACGEGRDTRELLSRGWRVFAFDASALGISKLLGSAPPQMQARLTATELRFEDVLLSPALPASVDLVNASFALPFCPPPVFPGVWKRLTGVLNRGGLFAGQIFGDRDEWAKVRPESHFTRTAMEALFGGFEFVHLEEVEKDGADALAGMKHHHLFHIVARKLGAVAGH